MTDQPGILIPAEQIAAMTGYDQATKQLRVLHDRGFHRAYINRKGVVVLERPHYEAVTSGEAHNAAKKSANLSFLRAA